MVGAVVQCGAQLLDRRIQTVIKFDKSTLGPEIATNLVASYYSSFRLQQENEQVKGLILQPYPHAFLEEFPRARVSLKDSEAISRRGLG